MRETTPGISGCEQQLKAIDYRSEMALSYRLAPKPLEKPSFWGRLFGRMSAGSTDLTPEAKADYEKAQHNFSNDFNAIQQRADEREKVGAQQEVNAGLSQGLSHLNKGQDARKKAYAQALEGKQPPANAYLNRIGASLMAVAPEGATEVQRNQIKEQNSQTVDLIREYNSLVDTARNEKTAATVDQNRYAEVTNAMSEKLKPIIEQGIELSNQLMRDKAGYKFGDSLE